MAACPYPLPTAGPPTAWLSISEAEERTGVPGRTLTRWAAKGFILADRLGGCGSWLIAVNEHAYPISRRPFDPDARPEGPAAK